MNTLSTFLIWTLWILHILKHFIFRFSLVLFLNKSNRTNSCLNSSVETKVSTFLHIIYESMSNAIEQYTGRWNEKYARGCKIGQMQWEIERERWTEPLETQHWSGGWAKYTASARFNASFPLENRSFKVRRLPVECLHYVDSNQPACVKDCNFWRP